MELTPLSDGEKSSEEEEDQEEDASPDEQSMELTPPSEDEHTETGVVVDVGGVGEYWRSD